MYKIVEVNIVIKCFEYDPGVLKQTCATFKYSKSTSVVWTESS